MNIILLHCVVKIRYVATLIMQAYTHTSLPLSRPKIHRLPARAPRDYRHRILAAVLSYGNAAKLGFTLSSLALVVVLSALMASRFIPADILNQEIIAKTATAATVSVSATAVAESGAADTQGKTIILKEKNGMIMGRMARISPASPSSVAEVDNRKGQELLSIVNRH